MFILLSQSGNSSQAIGYKKLAIINRV